jgi:cytochrome c oxidase subunit 2
MTSRSWLRRAARLGPAAAVVLVTGCARNAPLDTLQPAGPIARQIDGLWDIVFAAAVVVFVVVEGLIVFAIFKFRQRKGDTSNPKQTHGNTPLEIAWTIAPALLLAVLAVPTISTIWALAKEPAGAVKITVTGHQWWWRYDYAGEKVTTANELHIPAGKPVRLSLRSADVIHSYWVPRLAGKQDVVPGRTNHLTIQADKPGDYFGTCVEYCGLSHANMRLNVIAHTPTDYQRWLDEQRAPPVEPTGGLAAEGKKIFEAQQCVSCHTIRGTKGTGTTGPDLTHFASRDYFAGYIFKRTDENLLREWLRDAPGQKPGSKMPAGIADMGLSEDDITALIAYLQGLR